MRLIQCYIENFGKLSSYSYDFSEGFNVIIGENGYGKTTLSVFIKAMFYGLDANKGRNEETERKRYTPWQGGRFGGSLTFESGEKIYRIERSFGTRAALDNFALYDTTLGKECSDFSEKIGAELFGIDADGFERTVFLSERNLSPKNQNPTLSAKLSDLVGVDGDMGNFDDAIKELSKREKALCLKKGKGGLIWDIRREIEDVDRELIEIEKKKEEYEELSRSALELNRQISELEARRNGLEKRKASEADEKEYLKRSEALKKQKSDLTEKELFFRNGIPTRDEIALFEGKHVEKAALSRMLNEESTATKNSVTEDPAAVEEMISALDLYFSTPEKKKLYPIYISLAIAISLLGLALGAFVSYFLYTVCLISPIFIFLGVRDLVSANTDSDRSDPTAKIRDFLYPRVRSDATQQELRAALLDLKAEIYAQKKEDERIRYAKEERKKKIAELELECSIFLKKFPLTEAEPFREIRARLAEYEGTLAAFSSQKNALDAFAAQKNIDASSIAQSADISTEEELLLLNEEEKKKKSEYYALDNRLNLLSDDISRADELNERRLELLDREAAASFMHRVTVKTAEHLAGAKDRLTFKYLDKTRKAFDLYIEEIGSENAEAFAMDTSFALKKTENGLTNPDDAYSLGTRELYALATRLALSDSLFPSDAPFVILDDPFAHFDDKKCQNALNALKRIAKRKQIIYLTCSNARAL